MKRFLVAVDGAESSSYTLEVAEQFLNTRAETEMMVLHVSPSVTYPYPEYGAHLVVEFERRVLHEVEEMVSKGIVARHPGRVRFMHAVGDPATSICQIAEEHTVDLIIVGNHGGGAFDRMFLGGVSHSVANRATVAVLVVKSDGHAPVTEDVEG